MTRIEELRKRIEEERAGYKGVRFRKKVPKKVPRISLFHSRGCRQQQWKSEIRENHLAGSSLRRALCSL
jgi:hypothetical protein